MNKNNIQVIVKNLNFLISKVNKHFNKNDLMSHEIKLGIDAQNTIFNYYLDSKKKKKLCIKYEIFNYDELNLIISLIRKIHLLNCHLCFRIIDENINSELFYLPANKLLIPKINDVILSIGNFFDKKLTNDNYIIKKFDFESENYIEIGLIFHNFLTISTFDFLVFNQRFYDINLSNNEKILNQFSYEFNFNLSDNYSKIKFKKFQKFNLSLFVIVNINYEIENEIENQIVNSIISLKNEFEQKINLYINKCELNISIQTIISSLETLHQITDNQELYSNLEKIFEPNLCDDNTQIENRLYKNFLNYKK